MQYNEEWIGFRGCSSWDVKTDPFLQPGIAWKLWTSFGHPAVSMYVEDLIQFYSIHIYIVTSSMIHPSDSCSNPNRSFYCSVYTIRDNNREYGINGHNKDPIWPDLQTGLLNYLNPLNKLSPLFICVWFISGRLNTIFYTCVYIMESRDGNSIWM